MAAALDLTHLRTFAAIADCGGFGRAATTLHVSQPTVSQHVRSLERRLGQTLVERSGRGARLTDAGERLLLEARRLLDVHDRALERLEAAGPRTIVIGSTETAAESVLPELLATLRDAFPDHTVQFRIDGSAEMESAVAKGEIDLAVTLGVGTEMPGNEIGDLPMHWYAAPAWVPPRPGEAWPMIAFVEPCSMRQRALEVLGERGRRVDVVAESTSLEGVLAAARAGLGVAPLPSAGRVPHGLVLRSDLPDLGLISVRLLARRGVDSTVEETAFVALREFYAAQRHRRTADPATSSIGHGYGLSSADVIGPPPRPLAAWSP